MPPIQSHTATPGDVFKLLRQYPLRWLLPAVLFTSLAVAYAKMRPADLGSVASADGSR